MLVGERMSHPVISVPPELPIVDALALMRRKRIRRTPVLKNGHLVGIVSDKDLLNASPAANTQMNVWEMNFLLSKTSVSDVMSSPVISVSEDTPIEHAALLMIDHKIGGLPVLQGDQMVGIITETDLFKVLIEMMGARELGVRVTAAIQDEYDQLAHVMQAISAAGGSFIAFGQFAGTDSAHRLLTFKVSGLAENQVRSILEPVVEKIIDLRTFSEGPTS